MGIQGLIRSVHSTQKNASTDKNVRAEGSDSSYLPGGEDGNDEEDDIESNSLEKEIEVSNRRSRAAKKKAKMPPGGTKRVRATLESQAAPGVFN